MMAPRLPLSHPYFATPVLSATDRQSYVDQANASNRDTVRQARNMELFPVYRESTHDKTQRRVTLRLGHDALNPRLMCMSAHTQVSCTIEAVADLYHTNTIQRSFEHVVAPSVLDRTCLYPLIHRGQVAQAPLHYVSLNWVALQMPSVIADRDFCYLECHSEFQDNEDLRRGWVRSVHSVSMMDEFLCPPLDDKFGITRGRLYRSGQVFVESASNPSILDMFQVVCVELHGMVSQDIQHAVLVQLAEECTHVDEYFRSVNLCLCRLFDASALASKAHSCACCEKPFKLSLFTSVKRLLCRVCGHTVCEACTEMWDLLYKKPVRVCVACAEQAKEPFNLSASRTSDVPLMTFHPGMLLHDGASPASIDTSQSESSGAVDRLTVDQFLEDHGSGRRPRQTSVTHSTAKIVLFDQNASDDVGDDVSNQKLRDLLKNGHMYNPEAVKQIEAALM
ncbi:hypothetical protein H257_16859 [Aphanomyces astaci]|uniref:FYVE-type domain-containing protein n=1 Tax=Aphanomyces astaci TaxID=112090 RepID=W4FIV9_APHAT|nr:hypothetical protein H257_16859 [Aphanomyces astaci]ETV66774.1 hypothetical protein H257_16859 [Aphanomyces astaci]|eukprot:XP_009843750.1 hypothetical protein H257_16859 [Aphanomyces astaci]